MKSYFRFLSRNKLYTFINIAGLVVSLMFIILMGDYTWRQYSIDSWHKNADRIYLMGNNEDFFIQPQAAEEIKAMCSDVEQICRVISQCGKIKRPDMTEVIGKENEGLIMLTDSSFFQFFDFQFLVGNRHTALNAPDKCVITNRLARKLFGKKSPIGESLQITGYRHFLIDQKDPYDSTLVYTVSAVVEDFDHTVFPNETQIIANIQRYPQIMGYELGNDDFAYGPLGSFKSFFLLRQGTSLEGKKRMIKDYLTKNYSGDWENKELAMIPLTDIIYAPQNNGAGLLKGDKTQQHILLTVVLAILFFAISNYINLTIANTGFRAKEMATRRLFGSSQHSISLKLIVESTLMVAFCFAAGLALAFCFQGDAAELFKGKIDLANDCHLGSVCVCLSFILFLGVVSGIIPSWHITRFQPIDIVKGNFRYHSKMVLERLFIIVQNIITVVMLTAALTILLQLNHLVQAPLGFNTQNLYFIDSPIGKSQVVRNKIEKMGFVERIGSYTFSDFVGNKSSMRYVFQKKRNIEVYLTNLDRTALELYGLKIIKDYGNTNDGYYLTEEAMRQFGYTEKDREINWGDWESPIAGVIRDFHFKNVLHAAVPFAIRLEDTLEEPSYLVKTNGDKSAKPAFESVLREMGVADTDMKWYVSSLEDSVSETFKDQQNTLRIVSLFTFIAIIISVLGYVGLSLFFIRQRKKEIAIRKVMGSTSGEVLLLMLRTFSVPMLISFVIAVPISWYIMSDWLTNFSYRIALSPWIFVVAGFTCFIISLLTVVIQSWRAASENPINNIKTE